MGAKTLVAAVALTAIAAGSLGAETLVEKAQRDEIARVARGDPDMAAAFETARKQLPEFLKLARAPRAGMSKFALKVKIDEGGSSEYFWIAPFTETDRGFSGIIDNTPRIVRSVAAGQRIAFSADDIYDWMYIDRGVRKGNFTACALLKHENPAEAAAMRRRFGLTCEPAPLPAPR